MNTQRLYFTIILTFIIGATTFAQQDIEQKTEKLYRFIQGDSIIRHHKEWHFDKKQRLVYQKEYHYSLSDPGSLWKEIELYFNPTTQILTQTNTTYKKDEDPEMIKLETYYEVYSAKDEECVAIWTKKYDKFGDIIMEDTATYNEHNNIINKCMYDYKGSTSLFCDTYNYNKKQKQTRWRTYTKWTTINGRSKVVQRQKKRRDYKYFYNSKGQHIRSKGKHYQKKFTQTIEYNKEGQRTYAETQVIKKQRLTKEQRKKYKKHHLLIRDRNILTYESGNLIKNLQIKADKEFERHEYVFEGNQKKQYDRYQKGIHTEKQLFHYTEEGKLDHKMAHKYDKNGKEQFRVRTDYSSFEKPITETQWAGEKRISTIKMEYDNQQNKVAHTMFLQKDVKFEKTTYIYKYH